MLSFFSTLFPNAASRARQNAERWRDVTPEESAGWNERAELAATLLFDVKAVADLGCGVMLLEKALPRGVAYHPVDIAPRDERAIVCDFNREPPPALAEAAACLGLLEYLIDPPAFLSALREANYRVAVVSYNPIELYGPKSKRNTPIWANRYSIRELEAIYAQTGWSITDRRLVGVRQVLWRLERAAH